MNIWSIQYSITSIALCQECKYLLIKLMIRSCKANKYILTVIGSLNNKSYTDDK